MHTVWVRLNGVVFFGLTVLLGLSGLAAISKIGHANRHKTSECRGVVVFFVSVVCTAVAYWRYLR